MPQRLNHFELSPSMLEAMSAFSQSTKAASTLDKSLLHLIDIRVSQINGCAFCVDMHVKEAKIAGVRDLKVHHVAIWRESDLFEEKEKAALSWAEAVTCLNNKNINDTLYQAVRCHFSEKEVSDLTFSIASINSWNRLAAPFRMVPGSADKMFGLERAGL